MIPVIQGPHGSGGDKHPKVKSDFAEMLLPDIVNELRRLRDPKPPSPSSAWPKLGVLQPSEHLDIRCQQTAYEHFSVMVRSKGLRIPSIEPSDEDAFLERIKERFFDDGAAEFECRDSEHLLVQNGAPEFRFHRRWGWWRAGFIGMAATLRDLNRPNVYSAADMLVDVTSTLRLAALMGGKGRAKVHFGYDPRMLRIEFDPSDVRARDRLGSRLGGVQAVGRQAMATTSSYSMLALPCTLEELATDAHVVAAQVVVPAIKQWHLARIDTRVFGASIPELVEMARMARTF